MIDLIKLIEELQARNISLDLSVSAPPKPAHFQTGQPLWLELIGRHNGEPILRADLAHIVYVGVAESRRKDSVYSCSLTGCPTQGSASREGPPVKGNLLKWQFQTGLGIKP